MRDGIDMTVALLTHCGTPGRFFANHSAFLRSQDSWVTQAANATDAQKQFVAAMDSALKNAPQGSEAAVAAVKNAVSTASAAIKSVQKAVKQATDMTEANINALAESAPKVAAKTKA